MAFDIPGVNCENGLALCDGDQNMYIKFLRVYISNIPKTLEKIRNVSEETLNDYIICVHGIKSNSDTIGAEETKKYARHLELLGKSGDLDGVLAQNKPFIASVENLVSNIVIWLEKYDAFNKQ
jgi:HPt (histidine-containing phosphotransfer) domain-containing protein